MEDKETITISKSSLWKYSTFVLIALVVVMAFMAFGNKGSSGVTGNVVQQPTAGGPPAKVTVNVGDSPYLGEQNAPVTIVEFLDYRCGFCGRHASETFPLIKSEYVNSGKVKYVVKDFAILGPLSVRAAEAAQCMKIQLGNEGYFKMHDKLMANQQTISEENLKLWARELGADGTKFDSCFNGGDAEKQLQADQQEGRGAGISGTPGFVINGRLVSGACPYSAFSQAIEAELQGKDWYSQNCQIILI